MGTVSGLIQVETPYPGELLYSVLARTLAHLGCESPKRGLEMLFGNRSIVTTPDLPTYLPGLAWVFSRWGLTMGDVMNRMTTLPYYLAFRNASAVRQAQRAMESGKPSLLLQAGAGAHRVPRPCALRYCPSCAAEDIAVHGEPYWRRAHQLPVVWCCPAHEVALICSTARLDGTERHAFVPLARVLGADDGRTEMADASLLPQLVMIARASERVLTGPGAIPAEWRCSLRARADEAGYLQRGERSTLESEFVTYYSPQMLSAIGAEVTVGQQTSWLRSILQPRQRVAPTLHHLLVHHFLDTVRGRQPAVVPAMVRPRRVLGAAFDERVRSLRTEGHGIGAIARKLGVDRRSVELRLARGPVETASEEAGPDAAGLAADRSAWETLMRDHPDLGVTALRKYKPALYARLYRHQRGWLTKHRPKQALNVAPATRVDWRARDARLLCEVAPAVAGLRQLEPPVRVTVARLLRALELPALNDRLRANLPDAVAAIEQGAESVSEFQVRRIHWHAARLEQEGWFSFSSLQRAAGLKVLPEWARATYGKSSMIRPLSMGAAG